MHICRERSGGDVAVARLNADGSNDTTFGSGGGDEPFDLGGTETVDAVAVFSNNKIVLAGGSDGQLAVTRFTAAWGGSSRS